MPVRARPCRTSDRPVAHAVRRCRPDPMGLRFGNNHGGNTAPLADYSGAGRGYSAGLPQVISGERNPMATQAASSLRMNLPEWPG